MLSNCIVKCKKNTCTGDKRGESKHTVVDFNRYWIYSGGEKVEDFQARGYD